MRKLFILFIMSCSTICASQHQQSIRENDLSTNMSNTEITQKILAALRSVKPTIDKAHRQLFPSIPQENYEKILNSAEHEIQELFGTNNTMLQTSRDQLANIVAKEALPIYIEKIYKQLNELQQQAIAENKVKR